MICTAPAGNFVLSNGVLRQRTELRRRARALALRARLPAPGVPGHAGRRAVRPRSRTRAPNTGVDVYYFVPPGREADARRSLGRTPDMIDFFSERIGVPYPYPRYSQISVADFIFGGMENTTATTLTDLVLLDERAALDHDVDGLVAHELAHQWWGDLLTCRDWSEAWLNEGFATYFEYVWREHAKGRDEADLELLVDADGYLAEAGRYQRPVVCRQYDEPIDLFDPHLYEKGGRVLHMLRHELGDAAFWRALGHYARKHARGSVETRDLARAIEDATGRNVDELFDQWIARPGHPELGGRWEWDEDRKVGTLRLAQKQAVTRRDAAVQVLDAGALRGRRPRTRRARQRQRGVARVRVPPAGAADAGDLRPGRRRAQVDQAGEEPRAVAPAARGGAARLSIASPAARALAELPDPASVAALAAALRDDPFWGVRAAAARALGQTRRDEPATRWWRRFADPHPRVRRAVAAALGDFVGDETAARALAGLLRRGDPSYFVEAEAARGAGPNAVAARRWRCCPTLLDRPSFQDVIRSRAIEGLGTLRRRTRARTSFATPARPGAAWASRRAVVSALAELARGTGSARGRARADRDPPARSRLPRSRRGGRRAGAAGHRRRRSRRSAARWPASWTAARGGG